MFFFDCFLLVDYVLEFYIVPLSVLILFVG